MIGTSLGPYKVIEQLGAGGMGEVYLGEDTRLGRKVAIKVLPAEFAADPERLARFEQEAKAAAALNHPHIAVVHDVGVEGETHFMVQEYLEGDTLGDAMSRARMPLKKSLLLAAQTARALTAAHAAGIVHRDLKPANIFVTSDGHAKVLDFGLAKLVEAGIGGAAGVDVSMSPTVLGTVAGQVMGTAGYMAPEQVDGTEEIDQRADIFSFGCVLYEMAAGRQPFAGESVYDTLHKIGHSEPIALREIDDSLPGELQRIVRKCLAKDRTARYQHADDLAVDLEALGAESGGQPAVRAVDPATERPGTPAPGAASAGDATVPPAAARRSGVAVSAVAFTAVGMLLGGLAMWAVGLGGGEPARPLTLPLQLSDQSMYRLIGNSIVLSPDGRRIAYVTGDLGSGGSRLWSRALDDDEPILLASGQPYQPFFSPDGAWIGYMTPGEMLKVPAAGGAPQKVADVNAARGASWSADDTIVYTPNQGAGLFAVSASGGGEATAVTTLRTDNGEISHRWPEVLPGGGAVLFTTRSTATVTFDNADIEVVQLGSGERTVVHRGGSNARYVPTGHIVYATGGSLFAVPFDLQSLQTTGAATPVVEGVAAVANQGHAHFSFAADGSLAYLEGGVDLPRHSMVEIDRSGVETTLWEPFGVYAFPDVSPDGSQLMWTELRDGTRNLWTLDLRRRVPRQLTFDELGSGAGTWGIDGIDVFFSGRRRGASGIYRQRADGSGDAQLVAEVNQGGAASVSSDGRHLTFHDSSIDRGWSIWTLELDGSADPVSFVDTTGVDLYPSFSPDGRWIAYQSSVDGTYEVYVRPFPERSGIWRVSSDGGAFPQWSSDGSELFFRSNEGLMVVPIGVEGDALVPGAAEPLVEFVGAGNGFAGATTFGGSIPDYAIMPDGQSFIALKPELDLREASADRVIFRTDWFDQLRRLTATGR